VNQTDPVSFCSTPKKKAHDRDVMGFLLPDEKKIRA